MPQDIFERADALMSDPKIGYNFTDEAFKKHGADCGTPSRAKFVNGLKHDLKQRYDAIKKLYDAGTFIDQNTKATAEEYMKLLYDEAYSIVNFHDALGAADNSWISGKKTERWTYKFTSQTVIDKHSQTGGTIEGKSQTVISPSLQPTTILSSYDRFFSTIYAGIGQYGAQLDAALKGKTTVTFAALDVPALPKTSTKPSVNPASILQEQWAQVTQSPAQTVAHRPSLWTV